MISINIDETTPRKIEMEIKDAVLVKVAPECADVCTNALVAGRPLAADGDGSVRRRRRSRWMRGEKKHRLFLARLDVNVKVAIVRSF
jgi:hypothetical protein